MNEASFVDLFVRFKAVLESREKLLRCLCRYGVQTEGWFKAELLCFLDNEKQTERISDLKPEAPTGVGRHKIDFKITTHSAEFETEAYIELKHWLIGYQAGTKYNANSYFGDPTSVRPDVEKLTNIVSRSKFIVILATENPGTQDWLSGVDKFNRKFSPLKIESLNSPAEFPSFYYLGCLKVSKGVS